MHARDPAPGCASTSNIYIYSMQISTSKEGKNSLRARPYMHKRKPHIMGHDVDMCMWIIWPPFVALGASLQPLNFIFCLGYLNQWSCDLPKYPAVSNGVFGFQYIYQCSVIISSWPQLPPTDIDDDNANTDVPGDGPLPCYPGPGVTLPHI